ncbi:MAG: WecB/TagA/CpsF family glycosyltransferase [Candidatus Caldatribacteriaceae bacterium]
MTFLGFSITTLSRESIVDLLEKAIRERKKTHVITINPEMIARQAQDSFFREVLLQADLLVPDGIGIVWGAKFLYRRSFQRIPGVELAEALFARGCERGFRFYLLGGKEGVVEKAAHLLQIRYPGLQIVGYHHGYFQEDREIVTSINRASPEVLLVGMGSPRQELWIHVHREELVPLVLIGVGGVFDVWSGTKRRAPHLMCILGLEWLFRVFQEPGRLKRIIPAFWRFGVLLLRERFKRRMI